MSSLINKAKDKIEQTLEKSSNKGDNPHSSNAGPHSSNTMNKVDPMIDSDRDHRNDPTSRVGGIGNTQEYNTIHGQTTAPGVAGGVGGVGGVDPGYGHTTGHTGGFAGHNTGHSVGHTGPTGGLTGQGVGHTSHAGDLGGHGVGHTGPTGGLAAQGVGHTGHAGDFGGHGVGHTVPAGGVGGGYGGAPNTYDNPQSTNTGPHRSNLANKLDPRFDNDNDNRNDPTSRVGGYGTQQESYGHNTGMPGTHGGVGSHGGVGTTTGHGHSSITPGSGNAQNTAGPHNSDLLNKLDPRVDADMDGSKTYGGNATYR